MNSLYLDTNFFLYLSDKSSPFHLICNKFLKNCVSEKILISTSAETIQEIVHYTKNVRQLKQGLKASKKTLQVVDQLLSVNNSTIDLYLKFASIYKSSSSRDLIHLASCIENKIDKIVTFDKDFVKFKELKVLHPS